MKSRTSWATSPVFEISGERFSDAFRTSTFNGLSAGGISHSPHGLVLYMEPPSSGGANYRNRGGLSHGGRLDGGNDRSADLAQPPALEVLDGGDQLRARVHHERSVTRDRLVQRDAADEKEPQNRARRAFDADGVAVARELHHLVPARGAVVR